MKILSTTCEGLEILRKITGCEARCLDEADENYIASAEILFVFQWKKAKKIISKMKKLKMLQSFSAGVNHFNFDSIPENVVVCTNSGANAWSVAEHALALMLSAARKIPQKMERMKNGEFPQMYENRILKGKNVGIIGFGNIGQNLAKLLKPFNTRIYAINRSGKYEGNLKIEFIGTLNDIDYILEKSNFVVLSLPLTKETEGLINRERLKKMKKDAILVNVARGKIVVEKDLYQHLLENPKFIGALDAWWHYGDEFKQNFPFEKLENVVLSPHCAGIYEGWFEEGIKHAAENIKRFIEGKTENVVRREDYLRI